MGKRAEHHEEIENKIIPLPNDVLGINKLHKS